MNTLEVRLTIGYLAATSLLLLCSMVACSRPTDAVRYRASCDKRETLSECNEYGAGTLAERREFLRKSCVTAGGRFAEGACPSGRAEVGRCELAGERRRYFADGRMQYTPEAAEHMCHVIEGSWSPLR
jgi:hypothetical protein